ncbi:MAG: TetR/AcrR family transcriptional regulator [Pseudomonadales bacterium]|jgi:AcrR family transcriptional regulator|nr:TetR/AcrR family transcriptional regulator [Pseudomonadales bacterium]MCP5319503.1 TetR/AcrR family transcriptional regulator [Pseudomonadales bacterium]MCP5338443.1 TetR/AcrR family transcriptional regulator [Pseudomonadales bacterium]
MKVQTSRDQQRQDTFARVFDAALQEFHRVGVEKARVSDICHTAGVAKGTFFFHFATKDDVLLERQRRISEAMASRIESQLAELNSVPLFVERLITIVLEEHMAVGDPELVRQINLAIVRRAGAPALGAQHTAFGGALAAQLDRLRHQGVLCESIDAVELADCVRLSFFGFLVDTQFTFESGQSRMRLLGKLLGAALAARVSVTDSATGSR